MREEKLYGEIWKEPATKVSKHYGISGSMLARICTALNVPRPKVGYWARVQHGHKVRKPKLPKLKDGELTTWTVHEAAIKEQPYYQKKKPKNDPTQYSGEEKAILNGEGADHKFVKATRKLLNKKETDHDGYVKLAYYKQHIRVNVSPDMIERALLVMNKVVLLCENLGIELDSPIDKNPVSEPRFYREHSSGEVYLLWEGEKLELRIREPRKRALVEDATYRHNSYKYTFTGELELTVGRRSYRDKKTVKVEDALVRASQVALNEFKENKARRLRWEEERRHEKFIREYTDCWRRQKGCEEDAFKEVLNQAGSYELSQQLRSYVEACERRLNDLEVAGVEVSVEDSLKVKWLRTRLEMFDPMNKNGNPWDAIPLSVVEGREPKDYWRW